MDKLKVLLKSWKTTSGGIILLLLTIIYGALILRDGLQSGDIDKLMMLSGFFPIAISLICAKDGDKSTEDLKIAETKIKELAGSIKEQIK